MFLLAHVNFFALKLSRIKGCGEGDGEEQRGMGGHRLLQTTAHVTIAECGQPDGPAVGRHKSCKFAHREHLTAATQQMGDKLKGKTDVKCLSTVWGHYEQLHCSLAKILKPAISLQFIHSL